MLRGPGGLEPLLFGAGYDASLSGFTDFTILTGDFYAEDITIDAIVYGGGIRMFGRDFIKITGLGAIRGRGDDATGAFGGLGFPGYTVGAGTNGGTAVSVSDGGNGISPQVSLGGRSTTAAGGDSSTHIGGTCGVPAVSFSDMMNSQWNLMCPMLGGLVWDGITTLGQAKAGCGGGAGGSSDLFPGHIGGGGGGGAGGLVLGAPEIIIDTGFIDFTGGAGGNAVAISGGDDCGGGQGGSGGFVQLIYGDLTFLNGGFITVDGGFGGDGAGLGGLGGDGGPGGFIYHYTNKYVSPFPGKLQAGTDGLNGADGT